MLRRVSLFQGLSRQEQLDLLAKGSDISLLTGQELFVQGEHPTHFYVVVEGLIEVSRQIEDYSITLGSYGSDAFFGEVPILAGTLHLASSKAIEDSRLYALPIDDFWPMLVNFPSVRKTILRLMASRIQDLQLLSQHHEKLIGLGTLAAGLAHELNNPASAAFRAVEQLHETLPARSTLAVKAFERSLSQEHLKSLLQLKREATQHVMTSSSLDSLTQSDCEEELAECLEKRCIPNAWKLAPSLVAGGISSQRLAFLDERVAPDSFVDAIAWLGTSVTESELLHVLYESLDRICSLVEALKSYSYVDGCRLRVQDVDLHQNLENTLTILSYKLRMKGVQVIREYANELPNLQADGSSLNQVWTNLIDNAIDAVSEYGAIWLRTSFVNQKVLVEIEDNGPGIPAHIQGRIFEPFFSTKEVGSGTGFGLALVHRIITGEHHGTIRCFSEPGSTRFIVSLSPSCCCHLSN